MSALKLKIDAEAIAAQFGEVKQQVQAALEEGVKSLASMTHAKTLELAQQRLKSSRKQYTDNLTFEEVMPGVWVVSLGEPALWIEEGRKSGSMVQDLLRKNAKMAKDGTKYKAIPFDHGKAPTQMPAKAQEIVAQLKRELKKEGIPFKGIERDASGNPRLGVLHRLNLDSAKPTKKATTPALSGLTITQRMTSRGIIRRDIMTFRMVSEKHIQDGRWMHPGRQGDKLMDLALMWAEDVWEKDIMPSILDKYLDQS